VDAQENEGRKRLPVNEFLNIGRKISSLGQLARELARFRFGGNIARKKEPEHTLGNNFLAGWSRRKPLLTIRDA
jgi:hypothetical protein